MPGQQDNDSEEEIQMATSPSGRHQPSTIREMQVKPQDSTSRQLERLLSKRHKITNAGEDVEKSNPSNMTGGNVS
jgi:hypothetical protein